MEQLVKSEVQQILENINQLKNRLKTIQDSCLHKRTSTILTFFGPANLEGTLYNYTCLDCYKTWIGN